MPSPASSIEVHGTPKELEGARSLRSGAYQFQWWALKLVDAKPLGGAEKKGADRGIDGLITFTGPKPRVAHGCWSA